MKFSFNIYFVCGFVVVVTGYVGGHPKMCDSEKKDRKQMEEIELNICEVACTQNLFFFMICFLCFFFYICIIMVFC